MIKKLILLLAMTLFLSTAIVRFILSAPAKKRAEAERHAAENQTSLNQGIQFLKPDIDSDIRFGRATPTP